MGVTHSDRIDQKKILKRYLFSKGVFFGVVAILALLVMATAFNNIVFPLFGYKFCYDSGRFGITEYVRYTKDESRILNILVNDTPVLGAIPSFHYLESRTGLSANDLKKSLNSLAEKGDITLDDNGIIKKAFPWADSAGIYSVLLVVGEDSIAGPIPVASALHAFSVAPLFGTNTRVMGMLKDTGETIIIEIENNHIVYTNHVAAVVYRAENFENTEFYGSPEGAEADHPGYFDINDAIRLDRALLIGNIISEKIKDKIEK